ncbi:MAG: hypothetical protein KAX18_01215 [Candidatus Lokiarchaeota archaeon]|nr:hypothetical protein [Candidatus Lokiarchaeota archaeon]
MKLWIIYKEGIGFSKLIAEMLQDRLEDYIDVSVGNAKQIDPAFLVEERLDYLIIGDIVSEGIPSLEIQNWLLKFWEISKKRNLIIKAISSYYITLTDILVEPSWIEFLQDNVNAEIIYPPILCLKFNIAELVLEDGTLELVKDYTNDFIEFLINNQDKKVK